MTGEIARGLVILLAINRNDTAGDASFLADKCANLRIFADAGGKFNLSCLDIHGQVLVVSQFTLYADTRKGRRPNFVEAAGSETAQPLYELFIEKVKELGLQVTHGVFAAMMQVEIHNDGPVTLMVES
jgi:D-tyrosyl-tRNA(Tyr) deacylase